MNKTKSTFLALLAVLLSPMAANADPIGFNFEYEFGTGEIFSGMLNGELQADLDTVIVTELLMASFTALPGVEFQTALLDNVATISGVGGSFITIAPGGLLAGFQMPFSGNAVIGTPGNFVFRVETFAADRWSLTRKVPEPTTLALLGIGLLGMGAARRRKKA